MRLLGLLGPLTSCDLFGGSAQKQLMKEPSLFDLQIECLFHLIRLFMIVYIITSKSRASIFFRTFNALKYFKSFNCSLTFFKCLLTCKN